MLRFAVIGHPISHSRSPQIHQAFAAQFKLSLDYQRIDLTPEQLGSGVATFFAEGGGGMNVTLPHKAAVLTLCSSIAPRAALAGAVNTLSRSDHGLRGDNTDGVGLVRDLQRIVAGVGKVLTEQNIAVIGAGGAARGVLAGLIEAKVRSLAVVARDADQSRFLAEHFAPVHRINVLEPDAHADAHDIIINATSAGISGHTPHIREGLLGAAWLAYDLSYPSGAHRLTPFLEACGQRGVDLVADGLGMLVEQAAEAFYLWHGQRPDTEPVLALLRETIA